MVILRESSFALTAEKTISSTESSLENSRNRKPEAVGFRSPFCKESNKPETQERSRNSTLLISFVCTCHVCTLTVREMMFSLASCQPQSLILTRLFNTFSVCLIMSVMIAIVIICITFSRKSVDVCTRKLIWNSFHSLNTY